MCNENETAMMQVPSLYVSDPDHWENALWVVDIALETRFTQETLSQLQTNLIRHLVKDCRAPRKDDDRIRNRKAQKYRSQSRRQSRDRHPREQAQQRTELEQSQESISGQQQGS